MTDNLKLAEECGGIVCAATRFVDMPEDALARLIARVRAEERERCALTCVTLVRNRRPVYARDCAASIRALPEELQ